MLPLTSSSERTEAAFTLIAAALSSFSQAQPLATSGAIFHSARTFAFQSNPFHLKKKKTQSKLVNCELSISCFGFCCHSANCRDRGKWDLWSLLIRFTVAFVKKRSRMAFICWIKKALRRQEEEEEIRPLSYLTYFTHIRPGEATCQKPFWPFFHYV